MRLLTRRLRSCYTLLVEKRAEAGTTAHSPDARMAMASPAAQRNWRSKNRFVKSQLNVMVRKLVHRDLEELKKIDLKQERRPR